MLFGMVNGQNLAKVKSMVERSVPRRYTQDLLANFEGPLSLVNLSAVKQVIESGERYQLFQAAMHEAGFGCAIVPAGETLIVEIWKAGTDPHGADATEPSQVP
jgi:hypothetical protein